MSVIGPRPQLVRDMVFMTPEQRLRHTVRPGLSGLAQTRGRNALSWDGKLATDLEYIQKVTSMHYSIVFLQLAYFLITIAKVFVYRSYFKKHYPWINFHVPSKNAILADRNSYIITEIAWTIFSSTDMIVLSFFLSTKISSVYTIYNLVFSNLNVLLTTVYTSISYMLGLSFYKGINKYCAVHDAFNSIFMSLITALMIVSISLDLQ